ncbi:MAG: hypothetical protein GX149_02235 [Acholeplasmataceae bacterium]|nr:hypothetical protein [Acholeplasmataceae bacterium]
MKKFFSALLLGMFLTLGIGLSTYAAGDNNLIDVYPYDQEACLTGVGSCTQTLVGSDHWTLEFNGYRYHYVRSAVRYGSELEDEGGKGYIGEEDLPGLSWNAFGAALINNTDETIILEAGETRKELTSEIHRIWAYFDETGKLRMVEDQVHYFPVANVAAEGEPEYWRFLDEEDVPEEERQAIRIMIDDNDPDGYVVEPLAWITWRRLESDPADESTWSDLLDYNPIQVHVPAGWTAISLGTHDRGAFAPALAFTKSLPQALLDDVAPMKMFYEEQAPVFAGIAALDGDALNEGVQIIAEPYQDFEFDLDGVTASWIKMFDDNDNVIKETEIIDFDIDIYDVEDTFLETISFAYDAGTKKYTPNKAVSAVDSHEIGAKYKIEFFAETPTAKAISTTAHAEIVVGKLSPIISGVKGDKYYDAGLPLEVLAGIEVDDGYGNDIFADLAVDIRPKNLNPYNPKPGTYKVDLEIGVEYVYEAIPLRVVFNEGEATEETYPILDEHIDIVFKTVNKLHLITDDQYMAEATPAWGSAGILVGADGKIKLKFDWNAGKVYKPDGDLDISGDDLKDYVQAITFEAGEVFIFGHGAVVYGGSREYIVDLNLGDTVDFLDPVEEIKFTLYDRETFNIVIEDVEAPKIYIVNSNYKVNSKMFENADEAILANVIAVDDFDARDDIDLYVSDDGGLDLAVAGTYNVVVSAEDRAGNYSDAAFQVTVEEPLLSQEEVDVIVEAEVEEALNEAKDYADAREQAAKDYADAREQAAKDYADAREQAAKDYADEREQAAKDYADAREAAAKEYADEKLEEAKEHTDEKPDRFGIGLTISTIVAIVSAGAALGGAFLLFGKKG